MENTGRPKRITLKNIGENLLEILNFERGIFYTIRGLALTPGKTIRHYLYEDRKKMVQPLKFLVIAGIINSILSFFVGDMLPDMSKGLVEFFEEFSLPLFCEPKLAGQKFQSFVANYQGLLVVFSLPVIAGLTFLVFRKSDFNYAEHIVISAYLFGFNNLLASINLLFIKIGIYYLSLGSALLIIAYFIYFCIRVFKKPLGQGLLLGLVFVIGMTIISQFFNIILFILVSMF